MQMYHMDEATNLASKKDGIDGQILHNQRWLDPRQNALDQTSQG